MADTLANQKAHSPQLSSQKPGLGFPIARFVVILRLATGSVLEAAIGKYQGSSTGENALFRGLRDELEPGDVVLGDRYYGIDILISYCCSSVEWIACSGSINGGRATFAGVGGWARAIRSSDGTGLRRPEWMDEADL